VHFLIPNYKISDVSNWDFSYEEYCANLASLNIMLVPPHYNGHHSSLLNDSFYC
jgi:hypothetical protein